MEKKYSRKHIGEKYKTKDSLGGYIATIIDGGSKGLYCTIQINNWVSEVTVDNLKNGSVKYPYHPSVCGIGYVGEGKHKPRDGNKMSDKYEVWRGMLIRCYNQKFQTKQPTYVGCSVEKSWLNYQVFAEWFEENHIEGFELDKDLLVNGNKIYSPETCIFIPKCLNTFIANNRLSNTAGYIGVSWHKLVKKWSTKINDIDTSKSIHLGYFKTPEQASASYQRARTTMAHRLKHKMILDYGITDLKILDAIDKL